MSGLTPNEHETLVELVSRTRWAALATASHDEPLASQVAVVADAEPGVFLLHLSGLALHTRNLQANPRASLVFAQADGDPGRDPQTLARISLQGSVTSIPRDHEDYAAGRARYLATLPQAEVQFGLGDFHLLRFRTEHARLVCGFGRAHRLGIETLKGLLTASR